MKNKDPRKITCKICWKPLKISNLTAKLTCMCDDEVRVIPLDRIGDIEYSHVVEYETRQGTERR